MPKSIDQIIRDASDNPYNIPLFGYHEWRDLCQEYKTEGELHPGLDVILPAIHKHISTEKPLLPITRPTEREMESAFRHIESARVTDYISKNFDPESVRNKFNERVDISAIISTTHTHNLVSGYWHNDNRYKCPHQSSPSTFDVWNEETLTRRFRSMFLYLWREFKNEENPIDLTKYRSMFRLSGYVATQFKPLVAKVVYDHFRAKRVIDISSGWGDRLAGFYCSNAEEYIGCDPNGESYELYKQQCLAYESILDTPLFPVETVFTDHGDWFECVGNKRVRIYNRPAEDVEWTAIVEQMHDLMFTSPPYFGIEKYAKGQSDEDRQSWSRYSEYDAWRDGFFYPVMDSMSKVCKQTLINIVDPVVSGQRYPIEDDIRSRYGIDDILGMKMSRRPITREGSEDKFIVEGSAVDFIEPVYIINNSPS